MNTEISNKDRRYNYKAFARAAGAFMTHEQIFGINPVKDDLVRLIKGSNLESMLLLASQFGACDKNVVKNIKNILLDSLQGFFGINTEKNKDEVLFAPQAILLFFKWLLAYGEKSDFENDKDDLIKALHIYLQVSDFLPKEIKPDIFLFHALSFTKHNNVADDLARSFYIYTFLAKERTLYKEKEFLDFNTDFLNIYGFSIEQYLSVCFALLTLSLPQRIPLNASWKKNKHKLFMNTELRNVAPTIIDDMLLDIDEAKEWAKKTINNSWNFTKFNQKPLLSLNNGDFIPLNYETLSNAIFDGLYHKIRHCYPQKDTRFQDFFGRPFEKYIEIIISEAINKSRLNYECIHEFDYGDKSTSLSSDLYIKLEEDLLIIEAKGARPTVNSTIEGDADAIEKDLNKLFVKPILQADTAFKNILDSKFTYKFKGVKNIYIISVNINSFPPIPSFYEDVDLKLKGKLSPLVKGYFNFSITDIEAMCYLISRKGKKPPIFRYLKNKFNSPEAQSFSWFLEHSSIPVKRSPWINEQLLKSYKKIYKMSFKNPEDSIKKLEKNLLK